MGKISVLKEEFVLKICFYALREYDELELCNQFKEELGIDFVYTGYYPSLDNVELARGCDAVSMTPCDMSAGLIEAFKKVGVKYITCRSVGYDHVDVKKAHELGMRVSNVCYPPNGVANYSIMLMLMCTRKFAHILKRVELQDYSMKNKLGKDISTCTVGIIGTGKIGATMIKSLSGFGCEILAYDPYVNESITDYATYVSKEEIFKKCDVISLHMNATDDNHHMISDEEINMMKEGVIIINTARGTLIDSAALINGIESGKVGGAGLDVMEDENGLYYYNRMGDIIKNRHMAILRSFPNVILSPHTAFYTIEDVAGMVRGCFESVYAFENGADTFHEVRC